MKTSAAICAALAATAIAQPHLHGNKKRHVHGKHQKRALVTEWVTETAYVTEYIDETSTVWVSPSDTATPSVVPTSSMPAQFFEPANQPSYTTLSTSTTAPAAAPVAQQSVEQAHTAPAAAPVAQQSIEQAHTAPAAALVIQQSIEQLHTAPAVVVPSSSPAPVVNTPTPQPVHPTSASVYVAPVLPVVPVVPVDPTTSSTPQAQPTATQAAAPSSGSGSGSGSGSDGGKTYQGKMTYYALGTGSCGDDNSGGDKTDNIVALSAAMMGDYANGALGNYCHHSIKISYKGKSTTGYVADKCPGCPPAGIDVSEKIFLELLGSTDAGTAQVEWEFI